MQNYDAFAKRMGVRKEKRYGESKEIYFIPLGEQVMKRLSYGNYWREDSVRIIFQIALICVTNLPESL